MLDRETALTLFEVMAKGLVFNLDFIPADKLDWKPAPDAKSGLEIVNHLAEFLGSVSRRLGSQDEAPARATNGDEAKRLLTQSAESFAAAVRGASSAVMGEQFHDDHAFTNGWIVTACVIDTVHHSGQIAYIQTLLGDAEIHYDETLPDFAVG